LKRSGKNNITVLISFVICYLLFTICLFAQNKLDVIVIDPGHGGKDPGTMNADGTQEKNIVLPIALRLGQLISQKFPEVRVIYTRDKDEFPQLHDRTKMANENKAKLFISIHANHKKQEETEKNGFEIYYMNLEHMPEAVSTAMNENNVLRFVRAGTDTTDKFIFSTLAQSGYMKYNEMLVSKLEISMLQSTQLLSRGPMQAGLWVNVHASMPSVLVETGYIDDPKDEKYLTSPEGQNAIATALYNAFTSFKYFYEMN
jgi:N-acetylmuramoyl-L-alanine amidase